uniref:AGC-kinase C-terminal domain-containing protein n=1 Tax=Gongylonema pulchrum TaxID=637853 RepID=A0A183D4Y7_9BILA
LNRRSPPTLFDETALFTHASSLPITIPAGRFWPPQDAADSVKGFDDGFDADDNLGLDKTILPQRPPKDLNSPMGACARSIQAADDPERLFDELILRRRHDTGRAEDAST